MRLFLYTDEPIISEAMQGIFRRTADIELEKIVESADQIVAQVQNAKPDLLLLSHTPELHLTILVQLHQTVPDCRVVLWTRAFSEELAHQAMELGVRGILLRTCSPELLVKCLRKVHEGQLWFDRQLTASHMTCHRIVLTHRQAQLAQMVAQGRRNREIAEDLAISEGAVKVYLSHLFEKLGTKDRMELAELVVRNVHPAELNGQFEGEDGVLQALYVSAPEPQSSRIASTLVTSSSLRPD